MPYYAEDAASIYGGIQEKAAGYARARGLTRWDDTRRKYSQATDDLNNYMSSGDWSTDRTNEFRTSATQAVKDLSNEMMRYGTSSNEYKTLKNYKNYYETALGSFDRMDTYTNTMDYIGNWGDNGYDTWHSEDEYNTQRQYLDQKRSELQSQIDEIEKEMKKKGEYYNADLDSLKAYMDMYDELSEGLDQRHQWDKQFDTVDDYVAYQNSFDYDKVMQAEKSLAEKQAELEQKTARLSGLEAKFSQSSNTLENALAAALGGDVGLMRKSSAMVDDPEGYQEMLALQKEVAQLQSDIETGQKDIDKYHEYQNFTVLQNYGKFDPGKNWEKVVDSLKEAYNKAEEGSVEQAKIGRQLTALAGSNWDGTDARGLFDEGNYLGRWYLQNLDVDADRKRYAEIEDELKAMGVATKEGTAMLQPLVNALGLAMAAGGDVHLPSKGIDAARDEAMKDAQLESDQYVHDLRAEKRQLNQNIESAEKYQNRAGFDASYNALSDEQRAALIEAGKAAMAENGKSYTNGKGQSVNLKNFESILDDETDPELRDKIYAAIGAELTGTKLGYNVADIVDAYSERLAQYAGYKRAEEINSTKWAPARWTKQVLGEQTIAGFNQFGTGVQQLFSDSAVEGNKRFYIDQATDQMIGENYGDPILNGRNFSQLLADTTQTTANMLPSILASSAVSYVTKNPTVGAAVGAALMGASSAGNAYQTALNEGWEKDDARIFAAITGAAEGGLQYLLGGIGKLGGITEEGLIALAEQMNDAAIRVATKTAIHIGSETAEELIQNRIERYLRWKMNGEDSDWMSWNEDDWYTVFVTALSTGVLEGPGAINAEIQNVKLGNQLGGNTIPSKAWTQSQRQRNEIIRQIGEAMKGDEALAHTLTTVGTDLLGQDTRAYKLASQMLDGKVEKSAINYGRLYNAILEAYVERDPRLGYQIGSAVVMGGAVKYHALSSAQSAVEAMEAQAAEVRKANKGSTVLDAYATALTKYGVTNPQAATKYGALINKVLSGASLTASEMQSLLDDSTAARAARLMIDQAVGNTQLSDRVNNGDYEDAKTAVNSAIKAARDAKSAQAAAVKEAVAQAAQAAGDSVQVQDAASMADKAGVLGEEQIDAATVQAVQEADAAVEAAQARLDEIKKMSYRELGGLKFSEEEGQDLVNAGVNMEALYTLQDQMNKLQKRADELAAIKMPSKANRENLANIRQQQESIKAQYEQALQRVVDAAIARAEAQEKADAAAAETAQSSSAGDVLSINGMTMTRDEYVASQVAQGVSEEEANAAFDVMLEQTGVTVKENVNGRDQSSNPAEERDNVHNPADGAENRSGPDRSGQAGVGRGVAGGTELFGANASNGAVYASEGARVVDSSEEASLHTSHPGVEGLGKYLLDSGFTSVRFVTNGKILVEETDPKTGKKSYTSVAALIRGTEMVLSLDFQKEGYDFRATAEHERAHLRLRLLRQSLGPNGTAEVRAFVTSTLQNLLGRDAYVASFKKYLAEYGKLYTGSPETLGHMINEEMFCDAVAGLNCWDANLGQFRDDVASMLDESHFDAITNALANGEEPGVGLTYEETEAMPHGLQMKETLDIADPFRHDVDTSKPPEVRPFPGEEAMSEDQQLMSIQSFTEATGFELERNTLGRPYRVVNPETGEEVTHVTADMMRDTPIGQLVQLATIKTDENGNIVSGHISEYAANKQYKMLADFMNLVLSYDDVAVSWELVGSQLFSGIKANSDKQYNLTIDFGTICRKTQAIVDAMSATMKRLGRGLSRREVEAVYLETGKAGEATPCPVCYVFSRWMGIGGLLDDISSFQNALFDIDQKSGAFTWKEGQEQAARELMAAVEEEARDFYDGLSEDEKKEYTNPKNGQMKLGKILGELKTKPNSDYESALKKLNAHHQAVAAVNSFLDLLEDDPGKIGSYLPFIKGRTGLKGNIIRQSDTDAIIARVESLAERAPASAAKDYKELRKALSAKRAAGDSFAQVEADMDKATEAARPYDMYQWLAGTVFKQVPDEIGETDGKTSYRWEVNGAYRPVVKDILFDLNKGADFSHDYPLTWAFRTGKGCAMGKAIMPYSDARVGETIQGVASGDVKKIKISNEENGNINAFLNGDTKERNRILAKAIENMRRQNLIGGMRLQSTSDFRFEWGSDYLITFFELQAMGANVQLYTKVLEAVDFLASTGSDVNISVMPLANGVEEYYDPVEKKMKKRLVFSSTTGVNADAAIEKAHQYDNVQLILVGINDENIRLALAGEDVTFVIPFHGSGQSVHQVQTLMDLLGEQLDVTKAQDYSDVQSDHAIPGREKNYPELQAAWDLRMSIIMGEFWDEEEGRVKPMDDKQRAVWKNNKHLQKLYSMFYEDEGNKAFHCFLAKDQAQQIFPYEYWDTDTTYDNADRNGEIFQDYCRSLGVIPRFSGRDSKGKYLGFGDFTKDKGYWKLLIDRKMYANKYDAQGNWVGYGKYRDQQKVTTTNVHSGLLDEKAAIARTPKAARSKPIDRTQTPKIVGKSILSIDDAQARGDEYDRTKLTPGARANIMRASSTLRAERGAVKSPDWDPTPDAVDAAVTRIQARYANQNKTDPAKLADVVRKRTKARQEERANPTPKKGKKGKKAKFVVDGKDVTPQEAQQQFSKQDEESNAWAPEFYSKMRRVIEEWVNDKGKPMPTKMAADQVVKWLNKSMGVKSEEIKWSGIVPYLEDKKTVTKEELLGVMAENEIRIETKVLESDTGRLKFWSDREWDDITVDSPEELLEYARYVAEEEGFDPDLLEIAPLRTGYGLRVNRTDTGMLVVAAKYDNSGDTRWSEYQEDLDDGFNYREILFKQPGLNYTNPAMQVHWGGEEYDGDKAEGRDVLAHARIQDTITGNEDDPDAAIPTMFVEEIQSDLHNAATTRPSPDNTRGLTREHEAPGFAGKLQREYQEFMAIMDERDLTPSEQKRLDWITEQLTPEKLAPAQKAYTEAMRARTEADADLGDVMMEVIMALDSYPAMRDVLRGELNAIEKWVLGESQGKDKNWKETALDSAAFVFSPELNERIQKIRDAHKAAKDASEDLVVANRNLGTAPPDVPFAGEADTYHEYVMKHLLRLAAEGGYERLAWTTAERQVLRWDEKYEEGYRIEYDQKIPAFMRRYVKQWGMKVGTTVLDNGAEVWSVDLNDEMRKSVLETGQPLFSMQEETVTGEDLKDPDYTGGYTSEAEWREAVKSDNANYTEGMEDRWGLYAADMRAMDDAIVSLLDRMDEIHQKGRWNTNDLRSLPRWEGYLDFVRLLGENPEQTKKMIKFMIRNLSEQNIDRLKWFPVQYWNADARKSMRKNINQLNKILDAQLKAISDNKPHVGRDLKVDNKRTYQVSEIKELFYSLNKDQELDALAKKVFGWIDQVEKGGTPIPIKFRSLGGYAGEAFGGKVRYDTKHFNNPDTTDQEKANTIIHELIHVCTAYAIEAVHDNEQVNGDYWRYAGGYDLKHLYDSLSPDAIDAVHTLDDIWKQIRYDPDFYERGKRMYGTESTFEMVAELSNPEFREKLKQKSLFQRIVDAVKRLFGIDTTNAYDAVSAAFDRLLESGDRYDLNNYNQYIRNSTRVSFDKFAIPSKASLTERRAQVYNENAQQRFSQQESENNGRENVDTAATRRVVNKVNQLLPGNDWARAFVEAARSGHSGVDAGSAWRADEKRQRRVIGFAAFFFESNKYAGFKIDRAVDPDSKKLLFEYGVPDFLNWFFGELAKDPEGLEISIKANLGNADKFLKGINNALKLDEEPNYPRSFYSWTKEDEAYMKAIEENDIATLEKMIKQAARKAGFNKDFYQHAKEHFDIFGKGEFGFHLGSWTQAAEFLKQSYNTWFDYGKAFPHTSLHLYASVHNPYVLPKADIWGDGQHIRNDYNTWFTSFIAQQLAKDPKFADYKAELLEIANDVAHDTDDYNSINRERITDILEALGYDALQYTNAAEGNKKRDSGQAYILWNPKQIKSADLITYDSNGDIIPFSQRFGRRPSFRYSMQEEAPATTNPFAENTLEHDLMAAILERGDKGAAEWATKELAKQKQKLESAKIIPPRVPTKSFVPMPTKEEMAAIEKERLDRIGKWGSLPPSEKADSDWVLPRKDEEGRAQSRFPQNVATANVLDEPAKDITKRFAFTDFAATHVVDSNAADLKHAKDSIQRKGYERSVASFLDMAEEMTWHYAGDQSVTKVLALGQQLLVESSKQGTYRDFLDVLSSLTLLATQAGKSLQAFQMLKETGPIGELYYVQKTVDQMNNKRYAKLIESGKQKPITIDPKLSKAVVLAATEEERNKAMDKLIASIAEQVPVNFMEKWNAWRHFAMLGNARTHIRNLAGNVIFMPLRFGKNLIATAGESIAVKTHFLGMTESQRTKALAVSRELRDFAKKDALVMQKELQGNGKYNPAQEILDARQIFKVKALDKASKWNGQMLEKEDWWFLAPAYQKALSMALSHTGFTVEQLQNTKEGQKALSNARRIAIEEAQRATYRDFSVAAAALNRLKRGGGAAGILLEGVLPFTKTPINILRRGVEYSPIGMITALTGLAKDYKAGAIDAAKFIDRMSAGMTGTMVAILGYLLAKLGCLRGKKDDKEEDFDKLQGYQDYSLQIGDVSMTIDWAAPSALPLFTGAAAFDLMEGGEELSISTVWDAMMLIAEPMMSLSMLDGLNRTLSAASYAGENEKIASIITSSMTSYFGQGVPTLLGQLARSMDGTRRQTYVDKNSPIPAGIQRFVQTSIQNKIPVWEEQKSAYIDQWGREDTTSSKALGTLENFLSPSYWSMVHTTDVDAALQELYSATKESSVLPSSPTKEVNGRKLTAAEYEAYARDVGTTKYNMMSMLVHDPRYQTLSDEEKIKAVKKIYEYAGAAGKYHFDPTYNIRKNGGVWVQEAEAMLTDQQRYNRIWQAIEDSLKD